MKLILGFFLLLCVTVFGIFFAIPTTQGQKEQKEEPTTVRKGHTTEREREYSKEYKKLYPDREEYKLTRISELGKLKGNGKEAGVSIGIPSIPTLNKTPMITISEFLSSLSCRADAVVVGTVKGKTAHLTEDETFVYTEYEFLIKDILKNNPISPIKFNENIQITRPGGLIKLDDQVIRVEDKSYEPLSINKEYLLFLRFVQSANGYLVADVKGDFVLENNSFKKLSRFALPKELESDNDSQKLLSNVRNSLSIGCGQF